MEPTQKALERIKKFRVEEMIDPTEEQTLSGEVVFRGHKAEEAGAAFFGLTDYEAGELFHGDFNTPLQAAAFIERKYLRGA